ncbi:hypothetical protein [Pseudomonas faucium]|uniref:hypothetical protein n=1 Tax=Pseudomonas faucium TaxID=2740518 RepID=UPI0039C33D60
MPIVFVHGVNNRDGDEYRENQLGRDGFLRALVAPSLGLNPSTVRLYSPYWGAYGVQFAWNMAVLPNADDHFENFGVAVSAQAQALNRVKALVAESPVINAGLIPDARKDLVGVVELIYASALAGVTSQEEARELAISYERIIEYVTAHPKPDWLNAPGITPDNFLDQLMYAAKSQGGVQFETMGAAAFLSSLKEGMSRLGSAIPDKIAGAAGRQWRKELNAAATRFTGDAFTYLKFQGTRESPGPIVKEVLQALRQAEADRNASGESLVVIAHSFGGEIMYEILTHFAPEIQVDCLVTVGSQVGLFEEMKLFNASDKSISATSAVKKVLRPVNVKRWLNVFDTNDVFSYRLTPVMSGVSDYHYDTGYSTVSAHGGYFLRPSFYKRLAVRLAAPDQP